MIQIIDNTKNMLKADNLREYQKDFGFCGKYEEEIAETIILDPRQAKAIKIAQNLSLPQSVIDNIHKVKYGTLNGKEYVEINGVKFGPKLVPSNISKVNDGKSGIRSKDYDGETEYYYDLRAYQKECGIQHMKLMTKYDLENALEGLFGNIKINAMCKGYNILSILLGLKMSGYINYLGQRYGKDQNFYLGFGTNLLSYVGHKDDGFVMDYCGDSWCLPAVERL